MLSVELQQIQDNTSDPQGRLEAARNELSVISNDVQALSHELHSSTLEYLGVVPGITSWCREFSERNGIETDFRDAVTSTLPFELGVALFRVLQEALHNSVKHSGVKRVEVELLEKSGAIYLTIADAGKGFDFEAVRQAKGLGLTSMRERVRLANGLITIDSAPKRGTTIRVRVSLGSGNVSKRTVA